MPLSLSAADLAQLQHAQRVLLAPLEADEPAAWFAAVCDALCAVAGTQHAALLAASTGGVPQHLHSSWTAEVAEAYQREYATEDMATPRALRAQRRVSHIWDVVPPHELYASRLHHEFAQPYRIFDPFLLLTSPASSQAVWSVLAYTSHHDESDIERRRTLLELVQPALEAGFAGFAALATSRARLAAVLDALPHALLVCDLGGRILHQTPMLTRLLAADPTPEQLRAEVLDTAAAVRAATVLAGAVPAPGRTPVARTVRTAGGTYRLRGSVVTEGVLGGAPTVLVHVEPDASALPTLGEVRERFGLTPREAEVARLLAERQTNREIAASLGISPHTAERHTERVLAKLGVRSRTSVRERLTAPDPD